MSSRNRRKEQHSELYLLPDIIAGKWTILIIRTLQEKTLRFNEIQKALPDTRQKVLTVALRKLERNGIVRRKIYPTIPPQVEYKLTSLGLELLELSDALLEWVDIHQKEIAQAQKSYDQRNKS